MCCEGTIDICVIIFYCMNLLIVIIWIQESLNQMLESVNLFKRAICSLTLPMINTSSPDSISYAVVTFCTSNNTLFEVSLNTINQVCVRLHSQFVTCKSQLFYIFVHTKSKYLGTLLQWSVFHWPLFSDTDAADDERAWWDHDVGWRGGVGVR